MEDHQIIELKSSTNTLAITYSVLLLAIISLIVLEYSQFKSLHGSGWSFTTVIFSAATILLILTGASYVVVAMTRPKTLTLDRQGIRLRMRGKQSLTAWHNIDQVIYTRITFGKNANSAVVVESQGQTVLRFGSGYTITPEDLIRLIDHYVKTRLISVPVVKGPTWREPNSAD